MNKKVITIFDIIIGVLDAIMCVVNLMVGNIAMGIGLGILAILIFGYAIMLKDL